jgi:hypothetical protein
MHTTNYENAFIEVAEDCPVQSAEIPPQKGDAKTVANFQFEMIAENPYQYTSDEVIFKGFAFKNNLTSNLDQERELFFSKGQACLRASPLPKRYGWGVHHDAAGKVAIYPMESEEYQTFIQDSGVKKYKAMRSKRG